MPSDNDDRAQRSDEDDSRSDEERLTAAVNATRGRAAGEDKDEVEEDLRASMVDQGLDLGDTSSLASDIADAADASP